MSVMFKCDHCGRVRRDAAKSCDGCAAHSGRYDQPEPVRFVDTYMGQPIGTMTSACFMSYGIGDGDFQRRGPR